MSIPEINISHAEFSELIETIYQAPAKNDWASVFNRIMDYTYSNKVFWYFTDIEKQTVLLSEFSMKFAVSPDIINKFFSRYEQDPYYQVTKGLVEGEARFLNQHFDLSRCENSEFYQSILVPMDSGQAIAGVMNRDADFEALFAINRGFADPQYTQQDINLVSLLTPHLHRSMHLFRELELYKDYASMNKSILDQSQKGIIVCDQGANILLANRFTETVFEEVPELTEEGGKLVCLNDEYADKLNNLIHAHAGINIDGLTAQHSIVLSSHTNQDVLIGFSPLSESNELNTFGNGCCVISIKLQNAIKWQDIQRAFSLTDREVEVLGQVYRKTTLSKIADDLGITYQTVRNHMQNIYSKCAVHSQSALMIKLSAFQ